MLAFVYWPTGALAFAFAAGAAVASIRFLRTRNFKFDSVSVAMIEIGMLLVAVHLAVGVAWDRSWNWNTPLTSALACGLVYAGYLILRHAVEEPSQRASFCAVFSIFAVLDIPIMILAIDWWTKRKGQPPVFAAFRAEPVPTAVFALVAAWLVILRVRREEARREKDAQRRMEQTI